MSPAWPVVPLGEAIFLRKEFVRIDDAREYTRCRVQLHANGVVLRDRVEGALIKTKGQQVCRAGEFLVAEIDAKVGGFGIVPPELDGSIVSSHYFLFGVDVERLDGRFLDYYCKTAAFRNQVQAQGSTNYAAIRPQDVLCYTLPLPPLPEQRRIVAKIERLSALIEEANSVQQAVERDLRAIVQSESRRVFENLAKEYPNRSVQDVCLEIVDCLHSNPVYSDDGPPTVRSPDVGWGKLLLQSARRTSEAEYERRTVRSEPSPGDIILVREGGGTGKAGLVEEGMRLSLGQRVMQLRPDPARVDPQFLLQQWLSPTIQEDRIAALSKGSASPHLNIAAIRVIQLVVPPQDVQRGVIRHLSAVRRGCERLDAEHAQAGAALGAMIPALLDQAFAGEL